MEDLLMTSSKAPKVAPAIQVTENEINAAEWDAYAGTHPHASFFHQYHWLTLIEATYGGRPHYIAAHQDGRVVGILPLMERKVIGGKHIAISVPFADEGGLIADTPQVEAALIEKAREIGASNGIGYVELRQAVALDEACLVDSSRVTMKRSLPSTADELWKSFKSEIRNRTRKAEQARLTVSWAKEAHSAIDEGLYSVYSENTRDLGSPMHHPKFFHTLADLFPEQAVPVRVLLDDRTVGAAMAVIHNGVFSVPWVGSLRSHFALCPNNVLYWQLMRMAIEAKCSIFDFGRSAKDSGTYQFKQRWGAKECPLFYSFIPIGTVPQIEEKKENPAYQAFSKIWQKTPLCIARAVGPKLFARLPI